MATTPVTLGEWWRQIINDLGGNPDQSPVDITSISAIMRQFDVALIAAITNESPG